MLRIYIDVTVQGQQNLYVRPASSVIQIRTEYLIR